MSEDASPKERNSISGSAPGENPAQASTYPANLFKALLKLREGSREVSFATDAVKNVALFILVALSAAGLHKVVEWLEHNFGLPEVVTNGLYLVAYAIFFVDIISILVFLVKESWERLSEIRLALAARIFIWSALIIAGILAGPYVKQWYIRALLMLVKQT